MVVAPLTALTILTPALHENRLGSGHVDGSTGRFKVTYIQVMNRQRGMAHMYRCFFVYGQWAKREESL